MSTTTLSNRGTNIVTLDNAIVSMAMLRSLSNFHLESWNIEYLILTDNFINSKLNIEY